MKYCIAKFDHIKTVTEEVFNKALIHSPIKVETQEDVMILMGAASEGIAFEISDDDYNEIFGTEQ